MMMTFCKKSEHSFLGFPNTNDNGTVNIDSHFHHQNSTTAAGGAVSTDYQKTVEKSSTFSSILASTTKRDPGGIGFIDDIGGSVDGLMSCTESLGFESSDERRVDDQIKNLNDIEELCLRRRSFVCSKWKREHVKGEIKKFPPPLSSLNQNGKPTFFLQPVRKDGKLELKEVQIRRPEILHASRLDGRLRMHLIRNEDEDIEEQSEEEEEEEEEEEVGGETMKEIQENVQEMVKEKMGGNMQEMVEENNEEKEVEENEEGKVEGWQIPASPGSGEGFRRCHEQVSHHHHQHRHHHHELHVWRQHCVTIR